jgi:hydrogenase maturation protein HypF
MNTQTLPLPAPARVLACGAWLKNTACLVVGTRVHWSPLHGDLGTPEACLALDASVRTLLAAAGGRVDAVAHDLHPDFESTRVALALAERLGVPAIGVQHHHAHVAAVQAERGIAQPVIGLALDGVGLGSDGTAWGGEVLEVDAARWRRAGHLGVLRLPGGDIAAREPWRMAAAALHALGRGAEIVPRLASAVGSRLAEGVHTLLQRDLHCPPTTSAGRWFDAAAGLLGFSVRQAAEAEAAIALERAARAWIDSHGEPHTDPTALDLHALVERTIDCADRGDAAEGAAVFHAGLAHALASAAAAAAHAAGTGTVALGGGCFFNRVLFDRVTTRLRAQGLDVQAPGGMGSGSMGPGDAGLALGQAWVAAHAVAAGAAHARPVDGTRTHPTHEVAACA